MRLADFIEQKQDGILAAWDAFAAFQRASDADRRHATLRDDAALILRAIVEDLRRPQSRPAQKRKAWGRLDDVPEAPPTAAQTHALGRAQERFSIQQLIAEYRALRAEVLRLWLLSQPAADHLVEDIGRFNEAIDQAVAQSVDLFVLETERARNVFLSVLGHDLRTPLSVLSMCCRMLATAALDAGGQKTLERQTRSVQRMTQLLDDLLDYSRTSLHMGVQVALTRVDLAKVCREELDQQQAALGTDRSLDFYCDGPVPLLADASRLRQVLANLVDNARKYGAAGTPITVRLQPTALVVELSVTSIGPTLDETTAQTLFEPLRRGIPVAAEDERSHMGLGLFIVRQVAQAHGGTATVLSAAGKTTFTIRLPCLDG